MDRPGELKATRGATSADFDFLWVLVVTTMREYVVATWGEWDEAWQIERFTKEFNPGRWRIIVVDGRDAGGYETTQDESALYLRKLYILPEHQRRGIGSSVVRKLMADAQLAGVPLRLTVLTCNSGARRLYERLGLKVERQDEQRVFMSSQ